MFMNLFADSSYSTYQAARSSSVAVTNVCEPLIFAENGTRVQAASDEPPVIQKVFAGNGDELPSVAEDKADEEPACEEGNDDDDECLQRRLLRDAHLDYIYTQHKGKP
jgi:hypothetical protein